MASLGKVCEPPCGSPRLGRNYVAPGGLMSETLRVGIGEDVAAAAVATPAASRLLRQNPIGPPGSPRQVGAGQAKARLVGLFAGMVAAAVVVVVGILAGTGELAAPPPGLPGPDPLVRFGLPVARTVHDLTASLTVGLLVLAVWAVAPEPRTAPTRLAGVRLAMVRAASVSAGAWLMSAVAVLVFTVADIAGVSVRSAGFLEVLASFASTVDLGRALWVSVLLVIVVAAVTTMSSRVVTAAWAAGLALLALLPLALTGHASGSTDHQNSVSSLALHLIGVAVWVGGLGALLLMARTLGSQLPAVVRRYSTLAGWCFVLVTLSGLVNAWLRLGSLSALTSVYGLLVLGKIAALGLLGLAGWRHRTAVIPRLDGSGGRRAFLRLAGVELLVMGATMGLAVALSRSAPPLGEHVVQHGGEALLGFPVPPPMTAVTYLTKSHVDLLWLSVAAAALGWYLLAALRLRRRGESWAPLRTVSWVAGCLALVFLTSGGPAVYGRVSFSGHMLQHLGLMIVVPLLLVPAEPIKLALRSIAPRPDGSVGVRETLLTVLHSRPLRVLGDPIVAAQLIIGTLVASYYYTGAFTFSMFTHTGHVLMTALFLLTGYLSMWAFLGVDRGPASRPGTPRLRLLLLGLTGLFFAAFGFTLMGSETVLAIDWWAQLGLVDQASLLHDQQAGGKIAAAAGFLPLLVLGIAVATRRAHSGVLAGTVQHR
ncbi:MAG: hypothetical protein JWN06_2310 [Propionibacteriaceae bacterium]|jgi:cytochrome c oxidase assembly factor CtaG/putative copper export protein|nr:hypothetical protein [Propionibacteriaceae bacterium]